MQRVFFIIVVFSVYTLVYFYFRNRFLKPVRFRGERAGLKTRIAEILLFLFVVSPIMSFVLFFAEGESKDLMAAAAFALFGFIFTLFPYSLTRDIFRIPGFIKSRIRQKKNKDVAEKEGREEDISRRDFLVKSNAALIALAGFSNVYGFQEAMKGPVIFEHDVFIDRLPDAFDGFRIVQISDVHIGPILKGDFVRRVVDRVNSLSPDIVAITGDMVDGSVKKLKKDVLPLKDLSPSFNTYFITGNHEYYSGAGEWMEEVERLGMKVLLNSGDVIRKKQGGPGLIIGGVPDHREGPVAGHEYNPGLAFEKASPGDVRILLAHQPVAIDSSLEAGVDLQLSGHTHGGQFFPWNIGVGLIYPYNAGLYLHKNRMWVHVNRGTGFWGPPLRIGVPSEISLLRLRKKK